MQRRLQGCRSPKQPTLHLLLQVHLEAAQLSLHLEGPALAQHGLHVRRQAGRLSFLAGEPDQEQDAKQPVVLSVALTLKSAQLPGPAQARRLDTATNPAGDASCAPSPSTMLAQQQIVLCTSVMLIKPVYWLPVWIRMKRRACCDDINAQGTCPLSSSVGGCGQLVHTQQVSGRKSRRSASAGQRLQHACGGFIWMLSAPTMAQAG